MESFSNVRLSTHRTDLRPLVLGDAEALFDVMANPSFMKYWSAPPWTRIDQAVEMIASDKQELAQGKHLRLAIIRKQDAGLIGTCSLFNLARQCRRAEIGYGIAPRFWRQGYMAEAVSALITWAFSDLQLHRLEADIDPRNKASAASLVKLGFVQEGLLRERWIVDGEVSDSALFGLLARDWPPTAQALPD